MPSRLDNMDAYFVLAPSRRAARAPLRWADTTLAGSDGRIDWTSGCGLAQAPRDPLRLHAQASAAALPDLWLDPIPLVSPALRQRLEDIGLANVEFYPAHVLPGPQGQAQREYFAFNVVGRVVEARSAMVGSRQILYTPPWPQKAARGALVFRQVGRMESIFVHERIRRALLAADLDPPVFLGSRDV